MNYEQYMHYVYYPVLFTILGFSAFIIGVAIYNTKNHEPNAAAYRGCVASAYQATKNGEDLEANLKVCEQLLSSDKSR